MSENWQHKIFNHEEMPPANAWENIAKQLDAIDQEKNAPILPIKKEAKVIYWRIAAAACIATLIISAVFFLKNESPNKATVNNNMAGTQPVIKKSVTLDTSSNNITIQETINKPGTIKLKPISIPSDKNNVDITLEYVKAEQPQALAANPALNKTEKLTGTSGDIINDISLMNAPNSYVSFIGPNGQEIKVSSKFSNLLGYMDGKDPETEEYLDKIISESNFWRGKFKIWRNKMINTNMAPSPANFMNIVELSKLLQENK